MSKPLVKLFAALAVSGGLDKKGFDHARKVSTR
jgi:hypothetical protein